MKRIYKLKESRKTLYEINGLRFIEPIEFILRPNVNYRYTVNGKNIFMGNFVFKVHLRLQGEAVHFLTMDI